ncbi:MAG TPA: CGNR zinc finger domain-containing protein, partial [Gemmatimonadales bacterium]|nr:CGNR zinc finger domain-containing protein [Gemmatimonadales bacterium]
LGGLNDALTAALGHLRLAVVAAADRRRGGAVRIDRVWPGLGESLESPLWPVAWSAAALLVSDEATRIRTCGGPDCGWVFVDRSRNGLRRWCEMRTCGTEAKSRRRASRRA